jgi:hypothetical protein
VAELTTDSVTSGIADKQSNVRVGGERKKRRKKRNEGKEGKNE